MGAQSGAATGLRVAINEHRPHLASVLSHEPTIRLVAFLGILAILILAERLWPWAAARPLGPRRWFGNLGLLAVGTVLIRLIVPAAAMGAAFWAESRGWGLLQGVSPWLAIPLTVVLLDLLIYFQHRAFHAVPWLWRLHRVHHADTELDATSGLRVHPVELLMSVFIKMAAVVALGAPPEGVLIFEVLLNASSMFEHAAIAIPARLDRALRPVIITPSLHRIHHSVRPEETNSNFGFNLSIWDRVFGTLRRDHQGPLKLGIGTFDGPGEQRLDRLLLQPLREGGALRRGVSAGWFRSSAPVRRSGAPYRRWFRYARYFAPARHSAARCCH